jgi:uncharacterized membrane protein
MMLLQRIRNVLFLALAAAIIIRVAAWLVAPAIPLLIILCGLIVIPRVSGLCGVVESGEQGVRE